MTAQAPVLETNSTSGYQEYSSTATSMCSSLGSGPQKSLWSCYHGWSSSGVGLSGFHVEWYVVACHPWHYCIFSLMIVSRLGSQTLL